MKIKRRVVCVFGKFGKDTDFVLEPVCSEDCNCELCKNSFEIEEVKKDKESIKKIKKALNKLRNKLP